MSFLHVRYALVGSDEGARHAWGGILSLLSRRSSGMAWIIDVVRLAYMETHTILYFRPPPLLRINVCLDLENRAADESCTS
jgi:hypothetical protein